VRVDAPVARTHIHRGQPAVTLAAGVLDATFLPQLGMIGASLRCDGRQYLSMQGGLDAFRRGHVTGLPLLAPWANRLGAWHYRSGSTTVRFGPSKLVHTDPNGLPMHGTMAAQPWEVERIESGPASASIIARFRFGDRPDLMRSFPFAHDLEIVARLTPVALTIETSVIATGRRGVPVSFGWHPYFRLPGVARRDLSLVLPARRHMELDERMLPTGEVRKEPAGSVWLEGRAFDDGYLLGRRRRLGLQGGSRSLTLDLDVGYPVAQIYAPPGKAYVALEPMTAPANALVTGDHPTVTPGGRFTASFTVRMT
jgi:aldose 1-epimerase